MMLSGRCEFGEAGRALFDGTMMALPFPVSTDASEFKDGRMWVSVARKTQVAADGRQSASVMRRCKGATARVREMRSLRRR